MRIVCIEDYHCFDEWENLHKTAGERGKGRGERERVSERERERERERKRETERERQRESLLACWLLNVPAIG